MGDGLLDDLKVAGRFDTFEAAKGRKATVLRKNL